MPQTEVKGASGGVCSSIILADLDQIVVGVGADVQVQMSEDAYFGSNQTAIRCVARFDIQALAPTAVVVTVGAKLS